MVARAEVDFRTTLEERLALDRPSLQNVALLQLTEIGARQDPVWALAQTGRIRSITEGLFFSSSLIQAWADLDARKLLVRDADRARELVDEYVSDPALLEAFERI